MMAKMRWKSKDDLLLESKNNKKSELSLSCQESILSGFYTEVNGEKYRVSYDRESQNNLQERWQLFQNNMVESIVITAHLGDEDVRLEVDKEQFNNIYMDSVMAKENKIKKLRDDLFPLVDNAKSEKDLESITWSLDIIEPKPETIKIKDDKLLGKELKRVESDSAVTAGELMTLIFMSQMGMGG